MRTKTLLYITICVGTLLINLGLIRQLVAFSLQHESASHILLVPFLSAALILRRRSEIFIDGRSPAIIREGISIFAITFLISMGSMGTESMGAYELSIKIFAIVTLWIGFFFVFFGAQSFSKALLPLLLLFLMVPIPETLVARMVFFLQKGSAEGVALLFSLTGTPFHREGFTFFLPKISIEIASQCSGIRSSLALFLSSLLAADLMLESSWRKVVFAIIAIPMAMIKNAVRIAALSLIAIHVDMRILGSDLHRKGGVIFFVMALLLMWPILRTLRRTERKASPSCVNIPESS